MISSNGEASFFQVRVHELHSPYTFQKLLVCCSQSFILLFQSMESVVNKAIDSVFKFLEE